MKCPHQKQRDQRTVSKWDAKSSERVRLSNRKGKRWHMKESKFPSGWSKGRAMLGVINFRSVDTTSLNLDIKKLFGFGEFLTWVKSRGKKDNALLSTIFSQLKDKRERHFLADARKSSMFFWWMQPLGHLITSDESKWSANAKMGPICCLQAWGPNTR